MSSHITLSRLLQEERRKYGTLASDVISLLEMVGHACQTIRYPIQRGALAGNLGYADSHNVQGEAQKKLDIIANEIFIAATEWGGQLAGLASEELAQPYPIPPAYAKGDYLLLFDPLDGSSNSDVNISIGTIFSILRWPGKHTALNEEGFLQAGAHQVAAGYAIYGPQTMLVISWGRGVFGLTLDSHTGEFILTHKDICVPTQTSEFAINMSNWRHWDLPVKRYVEELLAGETGPRGRDFNMRWVASMVAEVHRLLMRGGIFMYPRDAREPAKPGKLRLLYEANPMAFLVEQAGGSATNGYERLLDVQPRSLHERVAVFLGSKEEVDRVTHYHHTAQ